MGMPGGATPGKKPEIHDVSAALEKLRSPFTPNRMTLAHILLQMRTMTSKGSQPHKRPRPAKPPGVVARATKRPRATQRVGPSSPKGTSRGARRGAAPPKLNKHGIEPCNCKKSRCLKLYCQCFAAGQMCDQCNCNECKNQESTSAERDEALRQLLERNPTAFESKITATVRVPPAAEPPRAFCARSPQLSHPPWLLPSHFRSARPLRSAGWQAVAPLRLPLQEVAVPEELL